MIPLLAFALLLTPMGLKISLALMSQLAPGELQYQRVTGTILGPLTVTQLSYRYQDQQISMDRIYLQWHPSSLLAGKFFIESMDIDNLLISTPHAPSPTPPALSIPKIKQTLQDVHSQLTKLRLPLALQINNANINNLTWRQQPGEPTLQVKGVVMREVIIRPDQLKINIQGQVLKPYPIQTILTVDGLPQQYRFELKAFNPQTNWLINGQVNPDEIQLDTQKALVFNGELTVHLVWKWASPMSWQLALTGRHIDLGSLEPDWPHPLDITLNTSGYLGEDQPHFSWNALIKTPQSQVATQGKHDKQWDVYWNLKIGELAEFIPYSSGSIDSAGELHGSLTQPQSKGQLKASLLRWQNYRVDKLNANWDVDISETRSSFIQLNAEQLFTQWIEAQKLQVSATGKWDNHQINATIDAYDSHLQLALAGGMQTDHWQGALKTMSISAPYAGAWKLSQPTALSISPKGTEVTALCLQSVHQSQLCLHAKWNGADNSWQTALTGRLNFEQIATFLPDQIHVDLPLDLHVNAAGIGKTINQAQFTGSTPAGNIRYDGDEEVNFEIRSVQVAAKLDKEAVNMNMRMELANNNSVSATLSLPQISGAALANKSQALQGHIAIELNNLAPILALIPDTVNPQGKFQANFNVSGTVGEPLINGKASVEGGEVKIPGLNIQLNQINLAVDARGSELNYTLTATSANRPLQIVGKTQLNEAHFPTELTLTGDSVLLADTPIYTVYVTPNIHVKLVEGHIDISGTVDIPKGVLHELEFQGETTLPEGEVVFIGEHPMVATTPWNMNLQLTVNLGKDVTVDTTGLKGKLSGSLVLISQPGQVLLGSGRIDITDGIYLIYGRQLTITSGSGIIYRRNPLSNPALSIQAITRINVTDPVSLQQLGTNEITVGMNIGGTSSSPQVTLFSSAGNLSQADMLSFLLLGTSSAGISPTNMNLMLQALNTLPLTKKGAGSVEGLTNQVKQGLGLSELGVESEPTLGPMGEAIPTATPTSYFVVGKRLTSRIYLRYKYDPFSSTNLFQLNYLFSTNWSLQLETDGSTQSGADILYTIQTGTSKSADKTNTKN